MPRKRKRGKEISVRAPDYIPKGEPILKDTTGAEAWDLFKATENVGKVFSFAMIIVGIIIIILSGYSILTSSNFFLNQLFVGVLGFVGAINILCGLLLLSKK